MESPQRILRLPVWEGVLFSPAAGEFRITDDEVFPPQKLKVPLSSSVLAKYFDIHAQEGAMVDDNGLKPFTSILSASKRAVKKLASIFGLRK